MPGGLTASLSAPLHRLLTVVGTGQAAQPTAALADVHRRLGDIAAAAARTGDHLSSSWTGVGATAAVDYLERAVARAHQLAERIGAVGREVDAAAAAVARVRTALERLIADFEARAAALETQLDTPGAVEELVDEARRALDTAQQLVEDLRTELGTGAEQVAATAAPAATTPAGFTAAPSPAAGMTSGLGSGMSSGLGPGLGSGLASGMSPALGSPVTEAALAAHRGDMMSEAAQFGAGEAITLPNGGTATAPNAVAASAVRHALTQLGVPYQWGGTTAGVGLDCSGLTQWAYHEAGLNIPRLAQEQDIGTAVEAGALRPGDLAVWDGHVAMVVGGGLMIEAGDPVQLSDIRTSNAGQGFQGFWRPTA
ncbi:MAG: C40 family peptidase [Mycobacterium sp.]